MLLSDADGLFAALAAMDLPKGDYVVCGSAALYVRGLRPRMGDLDVLARGAAWERALTLGEPEATVSGYGRRVVHPTADIEIMDRWTPGWSVDRLIDDADVIDGVPFMRLGDVLRWKIAASRPKDLPDIAAIRRLYGVWAGRNEPPLFTAPAPEAAPPEHHDHQLT
ncbi:hypothetical protein BLA24_17225 [Streptomyces cinnamoneus]|uniref:Nucleotidyltransferase family protein n=1 Tax=Streptomyces cinnamoneus TaxID=53446 RepID=A0A2G1XH42_STRCJ|nr:hypothetical protein [Streptomyces cinnamoneus]PHQ50558.1 hypothetical protein BLA24_17225 [Streptomyces cinnamoneus]PPT14188.1 hypothetical protein CYQ11_16050 [Streptomyces cinnamoneus]